MKAKHFLFLLLLGVWTLQAQQPVGQWRAYTSFFQPMQIATHSSEVYCVTDGGLFTYNSSNQEVSTYTTVDGLNGIQGSALYYEKMQDLIFIGYTDGKIDYIAADGSIQTLSDISRNDFFTQKTIKTFLSDGQRLFVGTDFGIVVYTLNDLTPKFTVSQIGTANSQSAVTSMALYENRLWVALGSAGLYSIPAGNLNYSDPTLWVKETGTPFSSAQEVEANSSALYVRSAANVYEKKQGIWTQLSLNAPQNLSGIYITETSVYAYWNDVIRKYENGTTSDIYTGYLIRDIAASGTDIYIAAVDKGLQKRNNAGQYETISPAGPLRNQIVQVAAAGKELYVAAGGFQQDGNSNNDPTGIFYFKHGEGWKNLNKNNGTLPQFRANTDFSRAYYDVKTGNTYLGSWGRGLVVLKNGELKEFYDCYNGLSNLWGIDTTRYDNTRTSGIARDVQGNLWVASAYSKKQLVVQTSEGTWYEMNQGLFPSAVQVTSLETDDYGGKWMIFRGSGIGVYYDNQTPADLSDDYLQRLTTEEGKGKLPSLNIYSIVKDQEGYIWIGTDQGVRVLYDAYGLSKKQAVNVSAPLVEGFALLRTETIKCMAVDGGNRKWIGTNNGVFLSSADGTEIIRSFTTENSPLPTNSIQSISVDPETGEVFIATDLGIYSYMGDATAPKANCEEVLVYPNPVFTDYEGVISIQGSAEKSIVKITSSSGLLVREIQAQGGMATWDGLDVQGNKVKSGIYLAFIANEKGENGCIGKFAVIQRGGSK